MTEKNLILLSLVIFFLPLLGFVVTIFAGKKIKMIYLFEVVILFIAFALSSLLLYFKLFHFTNTDIVDEFSWILLNGIPEIKLGILLDNLSVIMIFTVMLISFLVHLFSVEYMKGDPRYNRYFAYLGLFTFSMAGIVFTHNFLMMYIFWELVGLSSYLLIGFWYEKKSASDAAKKAFIVNRIGDIGMFLGIAILFITYGSFSFDNIFLQLSQGKLPFDSEFMLTVTGLLLFAGAVGKSAQFPLHVWLPDAMEGPTPVSALIHAATMVAAGVFFVTRVFTMLTGDALLIIATIGALSAFIPATIAITQNDIKKVLAYSTISQLGYMIMALGIGAYTFAFFHLITHAFFKACLFLGSGSVIHAMHHEQDITRMGGLRKKMPLTYATFLIATLALSGIPLTSGFLSKDGILAGTVAFGTTTGLWWFSIVGFVVALLTAFYMFRLVILTFHGAPANSEKYSHAHESRSFMVIPLITLALLSFFFWFTPNPVNADQGWFLKDWVRVPELSTPETSRYGFMKPDHLVPTPPDEIALAKPEVIYSSNYTDAIHHAHYPAMLLSLLVAGLGILLAFLFYQWKKVNPDKIAASIKPLYNLSYNKWYIDNFYNSIIVAATIKLTLALAWFDSKVIDGVVNASAAITRGFSRVTGIFDSVVVDGLVNSTAYLSGLLGLFFRSLQTGRVQTYVVMALFSLIILLFLFKTF